jgi:DNA-binding NarL/FixJ family response regulator
MKRQAIRVSIVENDDEFREHLRALIGGSDGFECVGAHASAEAALKSVPVDKPEVVLLDLGLPRKSGLEFISELKGKQPEIAILVLTLHDDTNRIFAALEAGASGYLTKPVEPARILEALMDVHNGGAPMSSQIARLVVKTFHKRGRSTQEFDCLTLREDEILGCLAKGFSYQEIADQLGISIRTVSSHLHNIYNKLHVRSRGEATARFLNR